MDNTKHALVLTGEVLAGYDPATVWPALAAYYRMEPEKLTGQLLARAPVTVKESDDLAKLQGLMSGSNGIGADAEIHPIDARGSLFVLVSDTPRGPVPYAFVEDRVRSGKWPATISVAAVGASTWGPFASAARTAPPPSMPPMPAALGSVERPAAAAAAASAASAAATVGVAAASVGSAYASFGNATPATATEPGQPLPSGKTIHAGFWRRAAALTLDSLIIMIPAILLNIIPFLGFILGLVGQWLYFAILESSPSQATIGKQVMGLKVTDDFGNPVTFGRATGRYFGKILSGMLLCVGYMLAGWTSRGQALHDMIAGTCVVFREVQPGAPLPDARPPMPWYGWLLNALWIGGIVIGTISMVYFFNALAHSSWH